MTTILAIDPGPERSAWVEYEDGRITGEGIIANEGLRASLIFHAARDSQWTVVIEKVESFGMAVGAEVFETVYWSGRFAEAASPLPVHRIGRKAVVIHLCGSARATDSNVRRALMDRYGEYGKMPKGPLKGVTGDVWAALAVAVTFMDLHQGT